MINLPTQRDPIATALLVALLASVLYVALAVPTPDAWMTPGTAEAGARDVTATPQLVIVIATPTAQPAVNLANVEPTAQPTVEQPAVAPTVDETAGAAVEPVPPTTDPQTDLAATLNDPALNGGNVAPTGCTFPIINDVCANGATASDEPVDHAKPSADKRDAITIQPRPNPPTHSKASN